MQMIYGGWSIIAGSHASLADIIELLDQTLPAEIQHPSPLPLTFQDAIRFNAVRFRYSSDGPWVLNGLNLTIPKGARVGFVGSTGSGKSTTLDVLMGLLIPEEGEFLVDGQPTSGNRLRAWQLSIAHVPQSIYLADATLAENIAFGVPPDAIDLERKMLVARSNPRHSSLTLIHLLSQQAVILDAAISKLEAAEHLQQLRVKHQQQQLNRDLSLIEC
jgi:ATP-binding cassette subfamily B protein